MSYYKTILCLACSNRGLLGEGYCIAGKEVMEDGSLGEWIRPISHESEHHIDLLTIDHLPKLNEKPDLLNKYLGISFSKHAPEKHQRENHVIDDKEWDHVDGFLNKKELNPSEILDNPDSLWVSDTPTKYNNKIPEKSIQGKKPSLYIIEVNNITLSIEMSKIIINQRRSLASFYYKGLYYKLVIKDVHREHNISNDKEKLPDKTMLCVSLTHVYKKDNCAHKLVAGIITP